MTENFSSNTHLRSLGNKLKEHGRVYYNINSVHGRYTTSFIRDRQESQFNELLKWEKDWPYTSFFSKFRLIIDGKAAY